MILGWVLFLSGSIAGVILFVLGFIHFRKWKVMWDTKTQKIADIEPGRVEVRGKIEELPGKLLHSPVTKTPCVSYEVNVQEFIFRGENSYLKTIHTDKEDGMFFIADDTGEVLINPAEINIDTVQLMSTNQGPIIEMDPSAREYIRKTGIEEKGDLDLFKKRLMVQESVIPIDKEYYVLGIAEEEPRSGIFLKDMLTIPYLIRKKDTIISLKSEKELARSNMKAWILYFIGSGFSLLLGIIGMIGALNM